MKNFIYWYLLIVSLLMTAPSFAAPKGICTADNGTFHSSLDFTGYTITAAQNTAGTTFNTVITNGASYPGHCHCDTGTIGEFPYIYYTAKINEALASSGAHSGLNYYNLNPNLDVGMAIDILGVGFVNAPFEYKPNKPGQLYKCSRTDPLTISSGAKAQVYFYIKKTFVGKVTIPLTLIVKLYGTISDDTPVDYSQAMADVYIHGDITAPGSCNINGIQVINFDFKDIPASYFSSTKGTPVMTHKITKTVTIECQNMGPASTNDISTSFYATEPNSDNSMVVTSNPDVGVKIYNKNDTEININGGELPTDMGETNYLGKKTGSVTFSAAPASLTGARPAPGQFNATATISFEIIH